MVGGSGPKRTIPLAAKWADQWNYPDFGDPDAVDTFENRLESLHSACRAIGRDPGEIEVSAQIRYPGDIEAAIDKIGAYRAAGASHLLISFMPPTDPALPGQVGETLAQRLET